MGSGLSLREFARDVTSGSVTSIISLVYSLSFAAMIFSGSLSSGFSQGIGALLIGTGATALVVALFSVFRFAVSASDGNASAVMATMAAAIASDAALHGNASGAVGDVLYLLAMTTFITGVSLALLGRMRAGRWIRFIPFPVVGGLLAATGALTISGGVRVMAGMPLPALWAAGLFQSHQMPQVVLGLAWAALLVLTLRRFRHALALPVMLLVGLLLFHGVLWLAGVVPEQARAQGWLFAMPTETTPWWPWAMQALGQVEWTFLLRNPGEVGTLVLITMLTVLINATGLEVESRVDADMDRELVLQGSANILAPLAGGLLGYLSLSRSLMNQRLGGTTRVSGIAFAVVAFVLAWVGMGLIGHLPRALLGGVLVFLGINILQRWVVQSRQQLPHAEYATLLLIFAVTVLFGFGQGLAVGIVAGCVLFAVSYSKLRVIKYALSGREYRSSHERSADDKAVLMQHGDELRIFVLQGFIFFGMADRLYRSVLREAFPENGQKARLVLFDMKLVHGVDASALSSFRKIAFSARTHGARLVVTGMDDAERTKWEQGGDADLRGILHFADLDGGVEYCENEVIRTHGAAHLPAGGAIRDWLQAEIGEASEKLMAVMQRLTPDAGTVLCRQGEPADVMYFVESGSVAIELALPEGGVRRLRSLGTRTLLGEMGLYRAGKRSANVVVLAESVVYGLSAVALASLERTHPEIVARFNAMVVRAMSERLEFSNTLVAALQR
jgi:sulfate permease, SulP family